MTTVRIFLRASFLLIELLLVVSRILLGIMVRVKPSNSFVYYFFCSLSLSV